MPKKLKERNPPTGLSRLFSEPPIWLYRWGLGRLLGKRFLLLNHTGRKSGLPRQAVVEMIARNESRGHYYVASGYGSESQWCISILAIISSSIVCGVLGFITGTAVKENGQ